jgi:hypothetical protein
MNKPEVINAFHPDFIRTHYPELVTRFRKESEQVEHGKRSGGLSKASRESVHGRTVNTINVIPKTKTRGK